VRYRREGDDVWHSEFSTRLHVLLPFDDADRGKRLIVSAAWINPRFQHGPWSTDLSALIN
jgi:hypothetical protein